MIISEFVFVKMNAKHISFYKSKGYSDIKPNQVVNIEVKHLPLYSKAKIKCQCDKCFIIKENILFINYNKQIEKSDKYYCRGCGSKNAKNTCIKKYGVDNPTKSKSISSKISDNYKKITIEEKENRILKQKETNFLKYGNWFTQTNDYLEKSKLTCLSKYGVENILKLMNLKKK